MKLRHHYKDLLLTLCPQSVEETRVEVKEEPGGEDYLQVGLVGLLVGMVVIIEMSLAV